MTREQFLLIKLVEELAEVTQRAIKQIQYSANQVQKGNEVKDGVAPPTEEAGLSNAQRLSNELADASIIADLLEEAGQVTYPQDFEERKEKKVEKLNKYLTFARSLGQIDGEWTI